MSNQEESPYWIEVGQGIGSLYLIIVILHVLILYREYKPNLEEKFSLNWFLYYGEYALILMYAGIVYLHFREHYSWWSEKKDKSDVVLF